MSRAPLGVWAGDLLRPAPLAAAAVLAINDHVLKGAGVLPGAVTGKLSDLAGLFVAGVLAVCLVRGAIAVITGRLPARTGLAGKAALVGVAATFGALKLWPAFNHALAFWGHNALDPTDLYAVPVLALVALWLRDRHREAGAAPAFPTGVALAAVLLLCAATAAQRHPPAPPRPYAGWTVDRAALALPCGGATAWVSKSGKSGFGITVRVIASEATTCPVAITSAHLRIVHGPSVDGAALDLGAAPVAPASSADAPDQEPHDTPAILGHFYYVTFAFDNNAAWNRGARMGDVELELDVGGQRQRWEMRGVHRYRYLEENP